MTTIQFTEARVRHQGQYRVGGASTVREITRLNFVALTPTVTIREALDLLALHGIDSLVVIDGEARRPVGVFTLQDVLHKVTIPNVRQDAPLHTVMASTVTVPDTTSIHQASLEMARSKTRWLVVIDNAGALLGFVTRKDINDILCHTCAGFRRARVER